jgi:hypothetical protein
VPTSFIKKGSVSFPFLLLVFKLGICQMRAALVEQCCIVLPICTDRFAPGARFDTVDLWGRENLMQVGMLVMEDCFIDV